MNSGRRWSWVVVLCLGALWAGCAPRPSTSAPTPDAPPPSLTIVSTSTVKPELAQYFGTARGAFVAYDSNHRRYLRFNPDRCAERFLPASTFKVLNSLIGLETGVIPDEDYVIRWDGAPYPVPAWNQDHTLKTATQNSVVWYYQELARRVGREKMQEYVTAVGYGNSDISGPIDSFWLDGGLRISADEQVEFLKRLYAADLPFSQRTMAIVKGMLLQDKADRWQLSGKTGTTSRVVPTTSWFVGYLETQDNVYFFATNVELAEAASTQARDISLSILRSMGWLP